MQISNSVAVITGGASGLGEGAAEMFLSKGGKVAIFDLNRELGEAFVAKHPGQAVFAAVDVSSEVSVQQGVAATLAAFGKINICVNCAGITGRIGRIVSKKGPYSLEDFTKVIQVNLIGTFNVARLVAAEILKNDPQPDTQERGVIINTASLAGLEGQMGQAAYSASKAGVIGLTLPLTRDLSQFGVRVLTIAPGLFETPMGAGTPEEVKQQLIATLEFPKRMGKPAEFAGLVAFLVENSYLNGEVIRIDAGTRAPPR